MTTGFGTPAFGIQVLDGDAVIDGLLDQLNATRLKLGFAVVAAYQYRDQRNKERTTAEFLGDLVRKAVDHKTVCDGELRFAESGLLQVELLRIGDELRRRGYMVTMGVGAPPHANNGGG